MTEPEKKPWKKLYCCYADMEYANGIPIRSDPWDTATEVAVVPLSKRKGLFQKKMLPTAEDMDAATAKRNELERILNAEPAA